MEEDKFSQINMDITDTEIPVETSSQENSPADNEKEEEITVGSGEIPFVDDEDKKEEKISPAKSENMNLTTVQIEEEMLMAEPVIDDDVELISPDEDIFKRVSDQLKDVDKPIKSTEMSEWTKQIHADRQEDKRISYSDTYANTSQTEHDFIEAFGLAENAGKTLNVDVGTTNQTTTEVETLQGDIHSDYYEYTDRQQRKEIKGMYKYAKKSIKTKIILSSVFAILLFILEQIGIFSKNPTGILNAAEHPFFHLIFDFLFFAMSAMCAYEQLYHGFKSIMLKTYIPESVAVLSVGGGVIYFVISLIITIFTEQMVTLCLFPSSLMCVFVLIFSYVNVAREKMGFSVISAKDKKFVFVRKKASDAEEEQETFSTTSTDFSGEIMRVEKADFIKRYFARTNESAQLSDYTNYYYILLGGVTFVMAIISLFVGDNTFSDSMGIWYVGFLLALPACILFSYSIPFYIGNRILYNNEVSIIGETTIDEYADVDVISVNDTTAFPPYNVKLRNFNVYNEYKPEKVLYYASSGFSTVGGPLADVFEVMTKDAFQKSKRAKYVCSGRSYLCVKVDADTIIFADKYGISSQGIEIAPEKEEDDEDISVMYMACNGKLCAKIYLQYDIDEEFAETVRRLNKSGIGVGIRTFDPNINNELIRRSTTFRKNDLRVVKLSNAEQISKTLEKVDSGIVSKGLSKSLLKAIPICKSIINVRKADRVVSVLSSIAGAVIMGLYIFGKIPFRIVPFIPLWYLGWMVIMFALTLICIPKQK